MLVQSSHSTKGRSTHVRPTPTRVSSHLHIITKDTSINKAFRVSLRHGEKLTICSRKQLYTSYNYRKKNAVQLA
jgi:hypothetical protein